MAQQTLSLFACSTSFIGLEDNVSSKIIQKSRSIFKDGPRIFYFGMEGKKLSNGRIHMTNIYTYIWGYFGVGEMDPN